MGRRLSLGRHALLVPAGFLTLGLLLLRKRHERRLRAALAVGRLLGRLAHGLVPGPRRVVACENMRRLASTPSSRLRTLEVEAYEHIGRSLVLSLTAGQWLQRHLRVPQALGQLLDDLRSGGVLVCSAHLGVWELVPTVLAPHVPERSRRLGLVVYRPLHQRRLNEWVRRRRGAAGIHLLPDRGAAPAMRRALRRGGLVGMLPDQRPSRAGVAASFLGREVDFSPGLAALRHATGAPVWFCVLLLEPERPRLRLHLRRLAERAPPPAEGADGGEARVLVDGQPLVQAYADALSSAVEAHPAQYFWWHRRFAAVL